MFLSTHNYIDFHIETSEGECIHTFSGADKAGKALPGDSVKPIENAGCELVYHVLHPPLVGLLELNTTVRYGFTNRNVPLYLFKPYNESYPPMLVASKDTSRTNQLAVAVFEHWTDSTFPRGGITKILGPAGVREIELEAIALQYSPWSWTSKLCPVELIHPDRKTRFILDKPTINIDPEGCLDIDDVLSLWKETKSTWTLAISISDVSAYVELNPSLRFAEKIGQTLYTREGSIVRSMFPTRFATDTFSLLPGKERFVLTLFATWNGSSLSNFHWKECCLTNVASYSYSNCTSIKELDITILKQIVSSLGGDPTDSHSWIESLMLLYNSEAAAVLKKANAGLLRSHSEPEQKRLINYARLGLPIQELAYPAATYTVCENETGHWGLKKGLYCHASSPIRRYADIINQEVLKHRLELQSQQYTLLATTLNRLEKAAKSYDRDCRFVDCLLTSKGLSLSGIIVELHPETKKVSVYMNDWRRIIRCPTTDEWKEGDSVQIQFHASMTGRCWKRKVIYRLDRQI